jgi:hypothetical protein
MITQIERVASDLLLFFAKKKKERKIRNGGKGERS